MLEVRLVRNAAYHDGSAEVPRFFVEACLSGGGGARIPVFWHPNPQPDLQHKEIYTTEVAGRRLQKGNLVALQKEVAEALAALARYGTWPKYLFRQGNALVPVYQVNGSLQARVPGGPLLSAYDIGWLYAQMKAYLAVAEGNGPPSLAVVALSPADLGLCPPLCMLIKDDSLWLPVFPDQEGQPRAEYDGRTFPQGPGGRGSRAVLALRREVAAYLIGKGLLRSPLELRVAQLPVALWEGLKGSLRHTRLALCYYKPGGNGRDRALFPIYQGEGELMAYLPTTGMLLFGDGAEALRACAAAELASGPNNVLLVTI